MKLNRKGFTLIELLAVIVVLGIILVIAIPKVVDTIENSRKGSFEASVKSYVKVAQQYVAKKEVEGEIVTSGNISDLDMQNKSGWYGTWSSDNGMVTIGVITNNDYIAYNATNDSVISSKLTEPFAITTTAEDLTDIGLTLTTTDGKTTLGGNYTGSNKNIIIPEGVTDINSNTFRNFEAQGTIVTNVIIPEGVITIGEYAFSCAGLTSVTIPSTVTNIGASAFATNNLTNVTIPSKVTTIGNYAFFNNKLKSIIIPSNVTTIGDSAFQNNQLNSVILPDTSISVGIYAFSQNNLTNFIIPSNSSFPSPSATLLYNPLVKVEDKRTQEGDWGVDFVCTKIIGTSNSFFETGTCNYSYQRNGQPINGTFEITN